MRSLPDQGPLQIIVLAGGASAEREVSLDSGRTVAAALTALGHRVELLDPAECPLADFPVHGDVIVPMLHGTGGEDGTLQRQLESTGLPWLGSSPAASALTFNKAATRHLLLQAGLPVAAGCVLRKHQPLTAARQAAERLGYPVVVKPTEQGSSVGISLVQHPEQLQQALQAALAWGTDCLLEEYVPGREITVPIVDDTVFPAVEILPAGPWYDYAAKYSDESTGYRIAPPDLPPELLTTVQRACRVCGVTAISRTDVRLRPDGSFCILEINTIPGMTSHSLVPMSAASLGIGVGELLESLIRKRLALSRRAA